jgi:hypothetical protein
MQIVGPEGQMSKVKLVNNGLYAASHLGSLRLPSTQTDLRNLRTLLERIFTLKNIILNQKAYYVSIEHKKHAAKKPTGSKQNMERSPYSPSSSTSSQSSATSTERYTSWVRGAWFPPSAEKDRKYQGEWNSSLLASHI